MIIIGIVAIFFFLNLSGFISHLTGEYYPQMTLDNSGVYYDAYYVQKADVFAMTWLTGNNGSHAPVDTDAAGSNMLLTYAGIPAKDAIFPEVISKNAFVLLLSPDYALVSFDGNALYVNSPKPFLDKNKNHIYDNGKVNIYK